ncbi:hypothetical protein CCP3SC15_2450002 [Gammaproteobacteria bacterium]
MVDVDWYVEADQPKLIFRFDQEKAAKHHIGAEQVSGVIRIAEHGEQAGLLHASNEKEDVPIQIRLPSDNVQPQQIFRFQSAPASIA